MADFADLQNSLLINFDDLSLLQQSLVHRSWLNENPGFAIPSNERLEFLGDALLNFVVAEKLYTRFPELAEGELTKLRATLICGETLARVGVRLQLGDYLYLGRGEEQSGGRQRQSNLASAFEAVAGAILVDQGFDRAKDFVLNWLGDELEEGIEERLAADYKSRLQELIQSRRQITPIYRIIEVTGPEHDREFTVEVLAGGEVIGRGSGKSKQLAEKEAARVALEGI